MDPLRNQYANSSTDQISTVDIIARAQCAPDGERSELEEMIVRRYTPMTRNLAHQFSGPGWDIDDLAQVANLALLKAMRRFNPVRGSFESYAKATISGELKNHLRDYCWAVKPPRRVQAMQSQIRNSTAELAQVYGELPSTADLAQHLGAAETEVSEAVTASSCHTPTSIDQPIGESGRTLGDSLCAEDQPYAQIEGHVVLLQICTDLSDEDRNLIRLRFFECLSQREIADELGISQMQVSRRLTALIDGLRARAQEQSHVA